RPVHGGAHRASDFGLVHHDGSGSLAWMIHELPAWGTIAAFVAPAQHEGESPSPRGVSVTQPRSWLPAAALCLLAAGPVAPPSAPADLGPLALADSTGLECFRLANGLRVVTRHVPGCRHVDVTVAYDFGSNDEARGKEGVSALLAELEFYGAT